MSAIKCHHDHITELGFNLNGEPKKTKKYILSVMLKTII